MVVKKGLEHDQTTLEDARMLTLELSREVFANANVDMHLCDDRMRTLRVVPMMVDSPLAFNKKMTFNNGDVFYASRVTKEEATKLGDYLVASKFFGGRRITVQLDREQNTWLVRMVVKKGLEHDQTTLVDARLWTLDLSREVFANANVVMHLCDDRM